MRKIISILLLSVVLLAFLGPGVYYPILKGLHQYQMRCWVKSQLPERFTKMVFSGKEAKALQLFDDNEFELDGKSYDIISKKKYGDKLAVYCVNDSDEDLLYTEASEINSESQQQLEVIKSISMMLYSFTVSDNNILHPEPEIIIHTCWYANNYSNHKADILSPPPQL